MERLVHEVLEWAAVETHSASNQAATQEVTLGHRCREMGARLRYAAQYVGHNWHDHWPASREVLTATRPTACRLVPLEHTSHQHSVAAAH